MSRRESPGRSTSADRVRRAFDLVAAAALTVVAAPVVAVAAVAIRVTLGRPVLFRQLRLGRGRRPFELVKLRTMRAAPEGEWDPSLDKQRMTRLGSFLRSTSIDELPSVLNLWRGDIGLVGPRPLPVEYAERFRPDELQRFEVRPGLTGLAQIRGRNAVDWDDRLALDVQYVRSRTLRGDVAILLATVPVVLGRSGVDRAGSVTMTELPADRVTP